LWIEAFVSFAVAIVPVSTENIDMLSDQDIRRTAIGCVSGKLRDSPVLAMMLGAVIIDILSPTMTASVAGICIFAIFTVLAFAQDKTMSHE